MQWQPLSTSWQLDNRFIGAPRNNKMVKQKRKVTMRFTIVSRPMVVIGIWDFSNSIG